MTTVKGTNDICQSLPHIFQGCLLKKKICKLTIGHAVRAEIKMTSVIIDDEFDH